MTELEQALAIGLLLVGALLTYVFVMWLRADSQRRRLETTVLGMAKSVAEAESRLVNARGCLTSRPRYEIAITDWGPDFTGEDGTLPRWRWVVRKADDAMEKALNGTYEWDPATMRMEPPEADDVLMLGNVSEQDEAMFAALAWIEERANPPVRLVVPDAALRIGQPPPLGSYLPLAEEPEDPPPLASDKIGYPLPYRPPVDPPPPPYQPVGGAE